MPEGIIVEVDDGFATIDFVDRSLRGPGLQRLLDIGGPETISVQTRSGPRRKYVVPEGNAREAGLLDEDLGGTPVLLPDGSTAVPGEVPESTPAGDTGQPVSLSAPLPTDAQIAPESGPQPVETPDEGWKLDDMRDYARKNGIDLDGARTKADVLAKIKEAQQ